MVSYKRGEALYSFMIRSQSFNEPELGYFLFPMSKARSIQGWGTALLPSSVGFGKNSNQLGSDKTISLEGKLC